MESPEAVVEETRERARALEAAAGFPHPLAERVRSTTSWMGVGDTAPDGVRFSALLLSRQATRPLEPPAAPAGRGVRPLVKQAVRQLVGWYGHVLCQHVGAMGQAFSRLGLAVADRVDRLEDGQARDRDALRAELDELRARLAGLETALSRDQPAAPSAH